MCARCGDFSCDMCRAPGQSPPICVTCYERIGDRGLTSHIPALSIVTMIHGGMLSLFGVFLVFLGFAIGFAFLTAPQTPALERIGALGGGMAAIYAFLGFMHLVPGALQLYAGWRIRTFTGRGWAIGAYIGALPTVFLCYCAPTSIALAIWGLIVLLDEGTGARFAATEASDTSGAS